MKSIIVIVGFIFFSASHCGAQNTTLGKENAILFEIGKTGFIYNLVFEHRPFMKKIGFRLGAGSNLDRYLNAFSIAGGAFYLFGDKKHFLESGLDLQYLIINENSNDQRGFGFVYPDYTSNTLCPSANIGYRVYGKNTLFRIGFSPSLIRNELIPGGYIGFGIQL